MNLILSLFPGIGLLDRAFEEEGFTVVRGPDVLWGGDVRKFHPPAGKFDGIIGGPPCQCFSTLANLVRAKGLEPTFGNLIPEFERCVAEAEPRWFLMENVPLAPVPDIARYTVTTFELDNSWLGEEQRRRRRFTFGVPFGTGNWAPNLMHWIQQAPLELPRTCGTITSTHVNNSQDAKGRVITQAVLSDTRRVPVKLGGSGKVKATHQSQAVTAAHGGSRPRTNGKIPRPTFLDACRLQGPPEDFMEHAPFRAQAKLKAVANGVPLPMGRAVAKAVRMALGHSASNAECPPTGGADGEAR